MEDCVSRCPSHLPEPTQEELDMEKDWEADPPPHLDLEKLASKSAQLSVWPERICQMKGDSIRMNMTFNKEKVRVGWERPDEEDRDRQDWTEQLDSTITELHQKIEEDPRIWVHDWSWTQTTSQPMSQDDHVDEAEIFYSEDKSEDDEVEIFYSEDEAVLGAAENDSENNEDPADSAEDEGTSPQPMPRRSGRSWAPTQRAFKSHGQQWDFQGTGHRDGFGTPQPHLPLERQPIKLETELDDPMPADDQTVRASTPEINLSDLVLESALDHKGRRLEPAVEGLGEPDPLVLARSPATMMPATQLLIRGPRKRAQAQYRERSLINCEGLGLEGDRAKEIGTGLWGR